MAEETQTDGIVHLAGEYIIDTADIWTDFVSGRCSNDPISFAVESAKLSGLPEPGKDWPPHAPNFRARRAQSVIRYRLNSPSISLTLSLFLHLCLLFSPSLFFFLSFVPPLYFFPYFSPFLSLSFVLSFLFFSSSFPPVLFLFSFRLFDSAVERPSSSGCVSRVASRRVERETNLVLASSRQLFPCRGIESIEIAACEGELIDTGSGEVWIELREDFSDRGGGLMELMTGARTSWSTSVKRWISTDFSPWE